LRKLLGIETLKLTDALTFFADRCLARVVGSDRMEARKEEGEE